MQFASLYSAIQHYAHHSPHALAMRGANLSLDYHELVAEVDALKALLLSYPVHVLGLWMDNSPAWVVSDLAAMEAGVPLIPLPLFFSVEQCAHAIRSSGCDWVITDQPNALEDYLRRAQITVEQELNVRVAGRVLTVFQLINRAEIAMPSSTCKITFTSGSTGQPKGVCLSQAHLLRVAHALKDATQARANDQHLCVLPLSTLLENVAGNYVPLLAGATMVVLPMSMVGLSGSSGFNVHTLMQVLHQQQASTMILTPELLNAFVSVIEAGAPKPTRLRFVAVGGASVSPALLKRAAALGLPVFEGYGLSECGSVVTLNTPVSNRLGTVGKPLPHLQIKIAPHGEVMVKGAHFLGYLGEEAPTEPSELDLQWLATGDLGQWHPDGHLTIVGRIKHMFITSFGRNVSPEWVERAMNEHPLIQQSALFGEAMPRNTAVIVLREASTPRSHLEAALADINATLPDYARVGLYVIADQPFTVQGGTLTANGRIKRQAIWQQYESRILHSNLTQETTHAVL